MAKDCKIILLMLLIFALNKNSRTWASGVAQVVEHLPSNCKGLSSNLILSKKKKVFKDSPVIFNSSDSNLYYHS
jgi:hypothetical protein